MTTEIMEITSEPKQLSLHALHEERGAQMQERDGWLAPTIYQDARSEYEAVRTSAGVIDLSARGRIEVKGAEAVQFLNGMISNDIAALQTDTWMLAAFPNVQGRLVALTRVLCLLAPNTFLFDLESPTHDAVLKNLMRFTFAGDFQVTDKADELALLSVQGKEAANILRRVFDDEAANIEAHQVRTVKFQDSTAHIIRATHTGEDGFDIFIEHAQAATLFDAFIHAGAKPFGYDALEILRIEAGIPRHGADYNEQNVVLETGLDEAVSYTKGCYLGQEIIARIHWRGHVARQITQLAFDDDLSVAPDTKLYSVTDDKEAGRITSATLSPRLGKTVAIALVRYAYLALGTELKFTDETGTTRTVRVTNNLKAEI